MVLLCSMSRWIFVISAVLLASRAFVRADGAPRSDDEDDCLIYEDDVDFLDGIQPAGYAEASKGDADEEIAQYKVVGALQPRDPSPYAAFELLDGLAGPTDSPIELLDSLRPMGRLEVEQLDSLPEPTKSTSAPSPSPIGMAGKYDGFELLDTLPQPTESTVDFLDELPSVGYSKVVTKVSTPAPAKPHKYEGFELLDSIPPEVQREAVPTTKFVPPPVPAIFRPTPAPSTFRPAATTSRPVMNVKKVRLEPQPVRDHLEVRDFSPIIMPTEPQPNYEAPISDQFEDIKRYGGIYDVAPVIPTTKRPVPTPKFVPRPVPTTSRQVPTTARPVMAVKKVRFEPQPVRDHLEVPRQKPVILPAEFVPNHQEMIEDQFNEIKRYGGIYDVAPVIPPTKRPVPTTKFVPRPIPTTVRPVLDVKKVRFEPQPVRDHLEVRDFSPIIIPAEPLPHHEAPIFDQFEDIKRYGGIYDVAPEMPKPRAEAYDEEGEEYSSDIHLYPNEKDVVSDQFGAIRGYGSPSKSSYGGPVDEYLFRPLAPVLDEFVTNDLGYGRPKRAIPNVAASSTQSKPKRKCLKRRPKKISHQVKKTESPKITEPSADAIQSSREASARCIGHRHGDLAPIGPCKKFYIRCGQEHKLMMCTRHGEVYSHTLYGCVQKTEAPECPSYVVARPISATIQLAQNGTLEEFCQQRSDGIYRHFADCARVIQCFDGDAFEYPSCPKKLVFDEKRGKCEYKRNVLGC